MLLPALLILFSGGGWAAHTSGRISVTADLSDAPRKMFHARLRFPVEPGSAAFYYPQWIPGEHAPSGPIDNLAGIEFRANGQRLSWKRDDVNMFLIRVTVPAGASELSAKVDFLATAAPSGFSAGASTSVNLAVLNWNQVLLYPAGHPATEITFEPSVTLPEGWTLGTALKAVSHEGVTTRFEPVALNMLIDSPVLAGRFFKEVALAPEITPKHFLDMAADSPEELSISDREVNRFSELVRETGALFQSRHYDQYHFLLTLSDQVAHFGLEHHQSSDDRLEAHSLTDDDLLLLDADLLPHEFTHSWNGKFRRPAGLVTEDYQHPMKTELLWVYEGLTQYLGDVLAARCGLWNAEQYRAYLASSAAEYDHRPGRTWRDLQDTATAAQTIYDTPDAWDNWRRGTDFYSEGELLWLEVDTTIRQLSKGKHSLNDFCARFYGIGGNTGPKTIPYRLEDLVTALNEIQVNDWSRFFEERLTSLSPHGPLDGIAKGGYILEYNDQPNEYLRAADSRDGGVSAWYSLGFDTKSDNTISDVLVGSLAYQAGLGPGMKLIAINGRRASADILRAAIRESRQRKESLELIVDNDDYVKVLKLDYHGGEKYPHLVRNAKEPNSLDEIIKPLTRHTAATSLE